MSCLGSVFTGIDKTAQTLHWIWSKNLVSPIQLYCIKQAVRCCRLYGVAGGEQWASARLVSFSKLLNFGFVLVRVWRYLAFNLLICSTILQIFPLSAQHYWQGVVMSVSLHHKNSSSEKTSFSSNQVKLSSNTRCPFSPINPEIARPPTSPHKYQP